MANKFDIANFNLFEFSKRFWDMFGDPNPKFVEIPQKDENGNIVNYLSPNDAQKTKKFWDDVGGALGQFNRTFYVNSVNGDDNNDGSFTHPFLTLNKAINSVQNGSKTVILLQRGQIFEEIGYRRSIGDKQLVNSYIELGYTGDNSLPLPKILLKWEELSSSPNNISIPNFSLRNSLLFNRVSIEIEDNPFEDKVINLAYVIDPYSSNSMFTNRNAELKNYDDGGFILTYIEGGCNISLANTTIVSNNAPITIGYFPLSLGLQGGTIKDTEGNDRNIEDLIGGIVKDANGIPRNFQINKVL